MTDFSNLSREELISQLEEFQQQVSARKKYGLVWDEDRTREEFEQDSADAYPVLERVSEHCVQTDIKDPQNVLIEGDNYHALTMLNYTHRGRVDVIYIDPPYNTGNKDFRYNDRYVDKEDSYRHSKWLSFMRNRLHLARTLLKENGVIFVSIDDNEHPRLRMLMDDIFGASNLLATFIWQTDGNFDNQAKVKIAHEYILAYAKNESLFAHPPVVSPEVSSNSKLFLPEIRNTIVKNGPKNPFSDILLPAGFPADFEQGVIHKRNDKWPHYDQDVHIEDFALQAPVVARSGWSSRQLCEEFIAADFKPIKDGKGQSTRFVITKTGAIEAIKERHEQQSYVTSVIRGVGTSNKMRIELENMGLSFSYPKPIGLIQYLISMVKPSAEEPLVALDFFAGSGTTGHAVLELNKKDGGKRQFILVTNNENGICEQVTFPRLSAVIGGHTSLTGEVFEGLGGNLVYLRTAFVPKHGSSDQLKVSLAEKCTELLCLQEGVFNLHVRTEDYSIFTQPGKVMGVYHSFSDDSWDEFKHELLGLEGKKVRYHLAFGPDAVLEDEDLEGVEAKVIPQKIMEIYEGVQKQWR